MISYPTPSPTTQPITVQATSAQAGTSQTLITQAPAIGRFSAREPAYDRSAQQQPVHQRPVRQQPVQQRSIQQRPVQLGPGRREPGLLAPGVLFSSVELQAMAQDGVLQQVYGECYLPVGQEVESEHRALAMSLQIPANLEGKLVLGRYSAAWVHGSGFAPPRVTALIDHKRRAGALPPFHCLQIHEVTLGRFDTVVKAGVRVTAPLRTAVDLAFQPRPTSSEWLDPAEVLARLCADTDLNCPLPLVRRAVESMRRVPHRFRALERLEALGS